MSEEPIDQSVVDAVTKALEHGRKIEAIKVYREATGKGLREAKEFVDALIPRLIERDPERFGKLAASGSGCSSMILLAVSLGSLVTVATMHSLL